MDKKTEELIAEHIAKELTKDDKENLFLKNLASITTLVAATGAFLSAYTAYTAAMDTQQIQEEIIIQQIKIDENQRLLNGPKGLSCKPIPTDHDEEWSAYLKCMNKDRNVENLKNFELRQVSNDLRKKCVLDYDICWESNIPTNQQIFEAIQNLKNGQ